MEISSIPLAQQVVEACKRNKIEHIVISPGSRNAPLTMSFYSDIFFKCYSIVDERCAAFFALGMAQQLKKPVALVCTSGSALLNYYPALSEAFYSNIALVVISADRPEHKIDIGDGQTIRQQNVFGSHSYYNANLSDGKNMHLYNDYQISKALEAAVIHSGPVHINVPFEEPLYQMIEKPSQNIGDLYNNQSYSPTYFFSDKDEFLNRWKASSKRMILVGGLFPGVLSEGLLNRIATDSDTILLTETLSNIHHRCAIDSIDKFLTAVESEVFSSDELRPDFLLTFGGQIISKKIKRFLRDNPPKYHYHIDLHKGYDTYFCLTAHIKYPLEQVLEMLCVSSLKSDGYGCFWRGVFQRICRLHDRFICDIPYSDMYVFHKIFTTLPKAIQLQLSNSSTIRYAQLFSVASQWNSFCNRGTSGIDGSVSTAIGSAVVSEESVVLITGDLSFFYDSNALWNRYTPSSFKMILINNSGGGIFRILPGHRSDDQFERFFETPHNLTAKHLCEMYGWGYLTANDKDSLSQVIPRFFKESTSAQILEIFTPASINANVLQRYFSFLKMHMVR